MTGSYYHAKKTHYDRRKMGNCHHKTGWNDGIPAVEHGSVYAALKRTLSLETEIWTNPMRMRQLKRASSGISTKMQGLLAADEQETGGKKGGDPHGCDVGSSLASALRPAT
jgi:hypothetical protein